MASTIESKQVCTRCQLSHHRANLRKLYMEAFTIQDLHELVYDHPEFSDLAKQLPEPASHGKMVLSLLQYEERRALVEDLLELAKARGPKLYEDHGPYFQPGKLTLSATFTISGNDAQLRALRSPAFAKAVDQSASEALEQALSQVLRRMD